MKVFPWDEIKFFVMPDGLQKDYHIDNLPFGSGIITYMKCRKIPCTDQHLYEKDVWK